MKTFRIILFFLLTVTVCSVMAVPAKRGAVKMLQPDGTYVMIELHGDEWNCFETTADGYTVVRDDKGFYVYAESRDGVLKATGHRAHDMAERSESEQSFLAGIRKHQSPVMSKERQEIRSKVFQKQQQTLSSRRAAHYDYNNFKGLIVLVQFNDKSFSRNDYPDIITDMVNKENYTGYDNQKFTGSVRDYFYDNSNGLFIPQFDIVGPYTLDYSQYDPQGGYSYGDSGYDPYASTRIVAAAVNAAAADVDFSQYDGDGDGMVDLVYFIFAGNGANYQGNNKGLWWPHRSIVYDVDNNSYIRRNGVYIYDYASSTELSGYTSQPSSVKIDGIGTICHEFSHVLGLPDFYDTDYEGSGGESNHPGDWSLMAGGSYLNDSRTPVGYSLYERYAVGFTEEPPVITEHGSYTLQPLCSSFTGYRINTPVRNEYFLLENRQQYAFKWDRYLPGSGMLVHRVDFTNSSVWGMNGGGGNNVNVNPKHNYYEVVRANGPHTYYGEYVSDASDVFPSKGKTSLTNTTTPANLLTWAGKPNALGLTNIKMTSGNITFDVAGYDVTAITLTPSSLTGLGVGLTEQLEVELTPSYAETTLTWKSSNPDVASVDENGLVKGISAGSCVITVTSKNNVKATCEVTVREMEAYTIAEFKNQEVGTINMLSLKNAEVLGVYSKSKTAYLRDSTGAVMITQFSQTLKQGDVLNGAILAQLDVTNNIPRAIFSNSEGITVTEGGEPTPRVVMMEDLTEADYCDLVLVRAVKLQRDNGIWAFCDDSRARLWAGNFGISTGISSRTNLNDKYYDVTAVYSTNVLNGNIINELNVTKAVEEVEAPSVIKGDVNGDGQVGIGDIISVTNYMASGTESGFTLEQADVNSDGQVGIGDIISISNIMAGNSNP